MNIVPAFVLGYLLGSIPFGLILTRLAGTEDLRSVGSGNIGATNVLRTGRKGLAAGTLLLDFAKAFVAVWIAWRWWPQGAPWAAVAAVVGHCFPVWLKFRGGKGVATMLGAAFGLGWAIGVAAALAWLITFAILRISSVGGISAAVVAPIAAWLLGAHSAAAALAVVAAIVLWQHRANIGRLSRGEEPRVGAKA